MKKKISSDKKKISLPIKIHPWRPCPLGQAWVSTHPYTTTSGSKATQSGHCRVNRSKKDHLYKDDIQEISDRHFAPLLGAPAADKLGFEKHGNDFDGLIRGWTRYWNEVLEPKDPLDPNLVKALIASESGFDRKAWNKRRGKAAAWGLMQVLNGSVQLLKDPTELKDHFVNLTNGDMTTPNLNICAGIRWLFRKKELTKGTGGVPATWREAVATYKSIKPTYKKLMPKFDHYYETLKGKK